jgi:ribosomal protein S18 acetylase RimI-like enzyme
VVRSRFTFAEHFAQAEPHLFTWELAGHGSRCTASVSWEGDAGSEADYMARTAADNRRDMTQLIGRGGVTALLAYVDGNPVGWCNYGETTRLAGLSRKYKLDPSDHEGVGSIACFVIAAPYRGHGVASRLLDEAIDRLRARGLKAVEAYPSRSADTAQANYHGPLEMFTRAGFQPYRELERFVVVRKELA